MELLKTTQKNLKIMSHAVVGFPSLEENELAVSGLVEAGVDIIELQVPFTDPVADGPTLVNACRQGLKNGGSVRAAIALAGKVSRKHPHVKFILMSYLNPLYRYGLQRLFENASAAGISGLIVPDWPVEAIEPHLEQLDALGLAPILMVTPNTPEKRLKRIIGAARGFIYAVARPGVTGKQTQWDGAFTIYINSLRDITGLPIAVGFGIRSTDDLQCLKPLVDVAAVCSKYIEWQSTEGSEAAALRMHEMRLEAGLA